MQLDIYKLGELQLSPDEFVFLHLLVHPRIHSDFPSTVDHQKLERLGYIKIGPDETFYARKSAMDLVGKDDVKEVKTEAIDEKVPISSKEVDSVADWIPDWRALFPMGVKTGGYSVRGTRSGCIKKMRKFFRNNPEVTKEQVFEATRKYVSDKQMVNFAYMKIADYFIEKDGASLLEEYVEQVGQGKVVGQGQLFAPGFRDNSGDLTDDI